MYKKSMLLRILLAYIIIGATLIAFLSSVLFSKFSDYTVQKMNNSSVNSLGQSVRAFDTLWNTTYRAMLKEFTTNGTLMEAISQSDLTPADYGDISRELDEIVRSNNMIYSVYAYNSKADLVFSTIGPAEERKSFMDHGIVEFMEGTDTKVSRITQSIITYRKIQFAYNGYKVNKNVISVVFSDDDFKSALIFNIDQEVLQNLITPEKNNTGIKMLIINNNGITISDSRVEYIYKDISGQGFVRKILSGKDKYGYFTDYVDGKKSLITYNRWDKWNQWDNMGWNFVYINDYENLFRDVRELKRSVLILTGLFIIISVLIAGIFTRKIYSPVYGLLRRIREKGIADVSPKTVNEYDYLKKVYDTILNDLENLKIYKSRSSMAVKKEFIERILAGELSDNTSMEKQITELNICLTAKHFFVIVFRIDNMKEISMKHTAEDLALLRFAVCNIAEELFNVKFRGEAIDKGEDSIVVIINMEDNPEGLISSITGVITEVQNASEKYLKLSLTAGTGSVEEALKGIYYSYKKAYEATNYRLVFGRKSILDYAGIISRRQMDYEYPFEMEKNLIEALKSADVEKVRSSMDLFISTICKYSYDEILLALNQLTLLSFRIFRNMLDTDDMEGIDYYTDYKEICNSFNDFDTIEDISQWLMKFYTNVITAYKRKRENKYEDIVVKIQKYIEENYSNQDISVEMLSEMVGLSTNYVRTLFKESAGKSISTYLNDIRIEKAKNLLYTTDYPVSKIADMSGFPGSYFYKAFKKATGLPPDEYRKSTK